MDRINCLVFKVNESLYAIEANSVVGIEKNPQLKSLPGTPDFVYGIMDFRGKLIPLISARGYFGIPTPPVNHQNDVLVVPHTNEAGEVSEIAFLTDGVQVITMLDFDSVNDAPILIRSFSDSVQRMTTYNGAPVIFLDMAKILTPEQNAGLKEFIKVIKQQ